MRNVIVMPIEGVLSAGDLRSGQPQEWARLLYDTLKDKYRIILLTEESEELARLWLANNFMGGFANVMSGETSWRDYWDWKVDSVREFLADGFELAMVVDVDERVLEHASNLGVMTMHLQPPQVRRGWKEHVKEARPWSEVVASVGKNGKETDHGTG